MRKFHFYLISPHALLTYYHHLISYYVSEPGYYEKDKFGIRIENVMRVVPTFTKYRKENRQFLAFEDVTFIPFIQASKLLDMTLLTAEEVCFRIIFFLFLLEVTNFIQIPADSIHK